MAYDDRRYGRREMEPGDEAELTPRGYPHQAGYHDQGAGRRGGTGAHRVIDTPGAVATVDPDEEETTVVTSAEAPEVFETRGGVEPGRDRLGVHLVWEFLLILGVAGLVYLLHQAQPEALRGGELAELLVTAAGFGLLALAAGVTLRAGAPNLAIGPVAAAAGAYFADRGGDGVAISTIFTLGVAIIFGLLVAALVVLFHVPGWAATLAAAGAVVIWLQLQPPTIPLTGAFDPTNQAAYLFAVVAALGILGGLLGTVRSVRQAVGRFRPVADPAARRGGPAAMVTAGALILSMTFAAVAGVILVAGAGQPAQGSVGVNWFTWTVIGIGVALAGGTSAYGRRGGVLGTILAVVALVLFDRYQAAQDWQIALLATGLGAVVLGLAVTRLVERFGRAPGEADELAWSEASAEPGGVGRGGNVEPPPEQATAVDEWRGPAGVAGPADEGWRAARGPASRAERAGWPAMSSATEPEASAVDSWSSTLPARPAPTRPTWEDDRWGR
ncbi:ABC transporter permease [Natronosporangium hydrolyticum]|uniref:ABC transporter permease n=1 Tax=Natronosporangium hydrolyticum TaxID=2811111 RepID=A0A895YB74_9ACTN|nr:ABC transporter permease [Natronosporangium hydrolyticum]QSB15044.1 ABC transporter permease [Natronosporangium hydrolyticum]